MLFSQKRSSSSTIITNPKKLVEQYYHLEYRPYLDPTMELSTVTKTIASSYRGEFCWSLCFDKEFIADLMSHGYLPMAERLPNGQVILAPKLHVQRCIVLFENVPPCSKKIRKKCKDFTISMNACFERVAEEIVRHHGENWFYPELRKAFLAMNQLQGLKNEYVRVVSFELWKNQTEENKEEALLLVAGECGYVVGGKVYCSLSGFSTINDSGNIQMTMMQLYLKQRGFVLWDLGMSMQYKEEKYGGEAVPRLEFLQLMKKLHCKIDLNTYENSMRITGQEYLENNWL